MKIAIGLVQLDISGGNVVEIDLPAGAMIRHGYVIHVPRKVLLAKHGETQVDSFPVLVVEMDPERPKQRRRLVVIGAGQGCDSSMPPLECELSYVTAIVNPNDGRPFVVYEAQLPVLVGDRPGSVAGEIAAS